MGAPDLLAGLTRVSDRNGGEYRGGCPHCGGSRRLSVHPRHPAKGFAWYCFACRCGGGIGSFLRARGIPAGEARRIAARMPSMPSTTTPTDPTPPCAAWQERARGFVAEAVSVLHSDAGARALAYLKARRGLDDATIDAARLGLNLRDHHDAGAAWGFGDGRVWLPRGIVIPTTAVGAVWSVNIRRPVGEPKYRAVHGSVRVPYGSATLGGGKPIVLFEGEFDALLLSRIAGDVVASIAMPAGAGKVWAPRIARLDTPAYLLCHDADDAGEQAAAWWLARLPRGPRRWRPYEAKDVSDMWLSGGDDLILRWICAGVRYGAQSKEGAA